MARLIVSTGEPAGIGPDIMLAAARQSYNADIITVGDPALFHARAKQLDLPIRIQETDLQSSHDFTEKDILRIIPVDLATTSQAGKLDSKNANYVLQVLDVCIDACMQDSVDAMVTGPIQKSVLNTAYPNFSGHTEYLAEKTQAALPVMMLATEGLRVALVTTHVPLVKIPALITRDRVESIIRILHRDLKNQFGLSNPKILIAGLNPHAGEDGHLGSEEQEIIEPIITQLINEGMNLRGPLPADTLFTEKYLSDADAVLAMYHDQGLPVLKYKGFGNAINITLGLPIVRTSVDHGTALDLAGTGRCEAGSMRLAINSAIDICKSRKAQST